MGAGFRLTRAAIALVAAVGIMAGGCTSASKPVPAPRPQPSAFGTLQGRVVATHVRGLVTHGRGPVAATAVITSADGSRRSLTVPSTGRFRIGLPAGHWLLRVLVADGLCPPVRVTVPMSETSNVLIHCRDGISTD